MHSKKCAKCGLVTFATAGVCKGCGAKLEITRAVPSGPVSEQELKNKRRLLNLLLVGGCFASFVLGSVGFAAVADHGIGLGFAMFFGVFGGGALATFLLFNFLKHRGSVTLAQPRDNKAAKILVFPVAFLIVLLVLSFSKFGADGNVDQIMERIGRLTGSCFIPAVITTIWINRSKQEWSWSGAALRYVILFVVIFLVASQQPR